MAAPKRPLLAGIKEEIGSLGAELRELAALRWQLARLEFQADLRAVKRLAVALVVAAVMGLCALPLLAACAADVLNDCLGISRAGWLLIFGLGLLLGGAAAGYLAWRRFRRRFTGMQQTLEELREDLVWLREWASKAEG